MCDQLMRTAQAGSESQSGGVDESVKEWRKDAVTRRAVDIELPPCRCTQL